MKSLKNGNIIFNDLSQGWDLFLMSSDFKILERLEGSREGVPQYFKSIKTRNSENDEYILWLRGVSEVSIVSVNSFCARHIFNFWNYKGKDLQGIVVALDNMASAIVGIGRLSEESQTIHVYDGGEGVSIFEINEVVPEVYQWQALEISKSGKEFFIGGS